MKPLLRSSGDILADRRADYAEMLFASGDHAAAAELMMGALELAPGWTMGWFRLGEMHEAAGANQLAAEAWYTALKLDPQDRAGAALKLELVGAAPFSAAPPGAFVEALFDHYAGTFDQSLVGKLGYRVPELLRQAINERGERRFASAVDLGCGTGLMGERLRPVVEFLEGHDISTAMLKKAEAKRLYDRLIKSDLQSLALPGTSADLVTAADVFMYVGALERVFDSVAAALKPGGLFAFSVERHNGAEDFVLRPSRRYAHSQAYLLRLLQQRDLTVAALGSATIRMDRGEPIEGIMVLAEAA
ncbi:methyltransferase domain-containing protein [Mesorhizobium sp. 1B3]|uniref:class I SAM-dependent DNA methyltransferase n=1 Tax=Mesorhizobium sp. 1B3 TaxID=3243599 RepID=UPI003D9796C6